MELHNISSYIDHTLLKPDASRDQIIHLCSEAKEYGFASVCINPYWVSLAAKELENSTVKVCTVVGFPLGANTTSTKSLETTDAIGNGADEIDMVINLGSVKYGDWINVEIDISAVVQAANGRLVKVILETCLLNDDEKRQACEISKKAGAGFVKTSTGFSTGGASEEDVRLMRATVGPEMGVKASGGIRFTEDAVKMIEAGASRIGASASVAIVKGLHTSSDY